MTNDKYFTPVEAAEYLRSSTSIRAAKQAGASAVELLPDGTIRIRLDGPENPAGPVEPDREVVL